MAGGAAAIMVANNARRELEERMRRRRMQGFSHDHKCPICNVVVGRRYCFCDGYEEVHHGADTEFVGYSRRCTEHTRYWLGILVVSGIALATGGFIYVLIQIASN